MKQMNEVFDLSRSIKYSEWWSYEMIDHADLAIRNVDALADALAVCIKVLGEIPAGELVNDTDRAYHQALDALNTYRGEK